MYYKGMAEWATNPKCRVVSSKQVDFQDCTKLEFDKDTSKVSTLVWSFVLVTV